MTHFGNTPNCQMYCSFPPPSEQLFLMLNAHQIDRTIIWRNTSIAPHLQIISSIHKLIRKHHLTICKQEQSLVETCNNANHAFGNKFWEALNFF